MTANRYLAVPVVLAGIVLVAGCSQKYGAERDGKKLGQAICDVRNATSAEAAQNALGDVRSQLGDLSSKYTLYTAEDQRDVDKNLADLAEHSVQGNAALKQQDLTVIDRSVDNLAETTNEVARAAWEGVQEGLADCTQ
jgi:hypothetical protein